MKILFAVLILASCTSYQPLSYELNDNYVLYGNNSVYHTIERRQAREVFNKEKLEALVKVQISSF